MNVAANFFRSNGKWIVPVLLLLSYLLFFYKLGDHLNLFLEH